MQEATRIFKICFQKAYLEYPGCREFDAEGGAFAGL